MIKLNDQKKLADDYIYCQKCNNFFLLSLIVVGVYMIILLFLFLLIAPLKVSWLFMFFIMMYLGLIPVRSAQLAEVREFWLQVIEKESANIS